MRSNRLSPSASRFYATCVLKMYHLYRPVYGVYTRRLVDVVEDTDNVNLANWFDSKDPVYVVTTENEYLKIKDSFPRAIHIVIRQFVDHRFILLISNRPPPA